LKITYYKNRNIISMVYCICNEFYGFQLLKAEKTKAQTSNE